jgi:hypothetical protein
MIAKAPDLRPWTMAQIKAAVRRAGGHWFDPGTMEFFSSRLESGPFVGPGGVYFVSSERMTWPNRPDWDAPRRYTVRQFHPDKGAISTPGWDHDKYATAAEAIERAKAAAAF